MVKGKWKRRIYFAGGSVLSLINRIIPKDERRICFFCKSGLEDNTEAFLHYLLTNGYQQKYRIICVGDKETLPDTLAQEHVETVSVRSCLWSIFRSKFLFCHGEMLAVMPSKKQISVNFWHGTPLKKINRMVEKLGDYKYDFFTYITATSEMFREIFAESFGCRKEQVLISGHPRCDYLFWKNEAADRLEIPFDAYQKVFLWMPTYRRSRDGLIVDTTNGEAKDGGFPLLKNSEDFGRMEAFLAEKNALLLIKIHPAQDVTEMKIDGGQFSHIRFLTSRELQKQAVPLYSIVQRADVLLTDYSSIYYDYLLLDRPEGFLIEDMDSYRDARGFVFPNPLDYMPGEKLRTAEELYRFLEDCIEGRDCWQNERRRLNEQVNVYRDGKNCERLCKTLGITK